MLAGAKIFDADVLIVGSGLAGLLLAIKLAESGGFKVVVATKGALLDSNSSMAQGGVAAVTDANAFDSPQTHLFDTLKSGAGLCNDRAAQSIIFGGKRLIDELRGLGVSFDSDALGKTELALEGGHSQARVLHNKDATGRAVTSALGETVRMLAARDKNFTVLEYAYAADLLVVDGVCTGARFIGARGEQCVLAPHTVLATGGVGQIFERTTNPLVATADGIALAYRAGARLRDMEFVQFHPTALKKENAPAFLISEAVRGAGATLLDHNGQRFVKRFHQDGELATRDIVSRAIHTVMNEHASGQVYLDMRPIGSQTIVDRFPNIIKTCAQFGVNLLTTPIPVAPAAHYMMGGVEAQVTGRTSVEGLYAIGESACTGLHGANRLASNSLLEAGVMALNLADELKLSTRHLSIATRRAAFVAALRPHLLELPENLSNFRKQIYQRAGIVRSALGLAMILQEPSFTVSENLSPEHFSARNIFQVGKLIALSALARRESRGAHLREDYPHLDSAHYAKHYWVTNSSSGWTPSSIAARTSESWLRPDAPVPGNSRKP